MRVCVRVPTWLRVPLNEGVNDGDWLTVADNDAVCDAVIVCEAVIDGVSVTDAV